MLLYLVVLFAAFSWLSDLFGTEGNTIAYSKVIDLFRQEQVKEFLVEGDQLTMLTDPYTDAQSDLVKIVGRQYVGMAVVGDKRLVNVTKEAAPVTG